MATYDIAVIGNGLLGSAALRHLTVSCPKLKVCGIGPAEPRDRKTHQGVFASHYDQGRITRILDPSPLWGKLARESIARYSDIEAESGVGFHHRVGCLRATDIAERVADIDACAAAYEPPYKRLDAAGCKQAYPFLAFSDEFVAWDEAGEAGYINPRQLIEAQLKAAAKGGATIIREIVESLESCGDGVSVQTREGSVLRARKALLTAGGYSNTLLRRKLDMPTKSHTILLAELPPEEIEGLRGMPSIISSFDHLEVESLYMLPPVLYPDGKTYIKLGPSGRDEQFFDAMENDRELAPWFKSDGNPLTAADLKAALHRMIPNLKVLSYQTVPCLITYSAHGNPYIDALEAGRLYVTTAGNGMGAKSSDEIGRIGALLCATGEWHSDLNREDFRAVYMDGGRK
ncbi:MAG: FAD-dependent oxidoreductase [Anaerolineae bacterium]|nr:FAD-dependent oxidoreductase [Anaerolineae bacterium]